MKRWRLLFWKIVLWHFCLTVGTGLLWNTLFLATENHRSPLMLHATYASTWLFIPFCQPFFWPLSDWAAYSGHLAILNGSVFWQMIKYATIAFVNSLSAVAVLFSAVWLVRFALSHPHKQTEI